MTTFPRAPNLMKGAIVGIDIFNPLASVILFQYNPKQLTRSLEAKTSGGGSPTEVLRLKGAPKETITLDVEFDAADKLEKEDGVAVGMGIQPQLAALEMLLYPKSAVVLANTVLMLTGTIEVISPEAPLTLFIWGPKRILPVRLTSFSITEQEFDVNLNPIRAKVSLGLTVLSYNDFPVTHPGYYMFVAHQVIKETMAVIASAGNVSAVAGGVIDL